MEKEIIEPEEIPYNVWPGLVLLALILMGAATYCANPHFAENLIEVLTEGSR